MGYDVELIAVGADVAREHFLCSVCLDLVENAVTIRECTHNFCQNCLDDVVRTRNLRCPDCRKNFTNADMTAPSRLMKNILSGIRLNCPNDCCGEQIGYDNFGYVRSCFRPKSRNQCLSFINRVQLLPLVFQKIGKNIRNVRCLILLFFY